MSGRALGPSNIHIVTSDERARERAELVHVQNARVMLQAAEDMRAQGVISSGFQKQFPDGTRIEVLNIEDVPLVAHIFPPEHAEEEEEVEEEEEKEKPPERGEYLWIGVRVCWEDMVGTPYPTVDQLRETGFGLHDLVAVLEEPEDEDGNAGEIVGPINIPIEADEAPLGFNDSQQEAPRNVFQITFDVAGADKNYTGPAPVPVITFHRQIAEFTPAMELAAMENYLTPFAFINVRHNFRYVRQPPVPVPQGGSDPIDSAKMGRDDPGGESIRITEPLRATAFSIEGIEPDQVYDFWAEYGYAPDGNSVPSGDLYAVPITRTERMYCANVLGNPDCIAAKKRVDNWVPWTDPAIENPDHWVNIQVTLPPYQSFEGTETTDVTGQLEGDVDGRNYVSRLYWSPFNSAPYDPMPEEDDPGHPWHLTFVVDPDPGKAPTDDRDNLLLDERESETFVPEVRPGTYTLRLGRIRTNWNFLIEENREPLIVEVAVMVGKMPDTIRVTQRFEVPYSGEAALLDESPNSWEQKRHETTYTVALEIDAIERDVGEPQVVSHVIAGEDPTLYPQGGLTYAD